MKEKIYLFILCIVFIWVNVYSQNYYLAEYDEPPISPYDDLDEVICCAAEAHPGDSKGGYLLCGFTFENHKPFLIRIDKFGNKIWEKYYYDFIYYQEAFKSAHYMEDGNFLVGGNQGLMKINSHDGTEMWTSPVEDLPIKKGLHYIEKIPYLDKFVVIGYDADTCFTFNAYASTGNWVHKLLFPPSTYFYCVKVAPTGHFIFSGYSGEKVALYRTTQNLAYDPSFGNIGNGILTYPGYKYGYALETCKDGSGYIVACENLSNQFIDLIKFTSSGIFDNSFSYSSNLTMVNLIWGKRSLGLKELENNSLLLGGVFADSDDENEQDLFIQSINPNGSTSPEDLRKFANPGKDCHC